jgi:AcrR family transcriptional regulator
MARTTQRDWLDTGLRLLAEVGADGLTIEALTAALGVTKGSFYHHFRRFQDFKLALLALVEREGTLEILAPLEAAPPGIAALHRLIDAVAAGPWRVEAAVRAWALQDEDVRACQARIDARRLAYLRALCTALSGDDGRAQAMADVLYALYVGSVQIVPPLEDAARRRVFAEAIRLYNLS